MCKHENQQFVGENTGPDPVNWCEDCGAIICGNDIELPKSINKPVETTNEQPICECCKTNKAQGIHIPGYSAEGYCINCWDFIKDLE